MGIRHLIKNHAGGEDKVSLDSNRNWYALAMSADGNKIISVSAFLIQVSTFINFWINCLQSCINRVMHLNVHFKYFSAKFLAS